MAADAGRLIPDAYDPRFVRFFGWYARLMKRRFNALRVETSTLELLGGLANDDRPLILLVNHASWWDPIVMLLVCERLLPGRRCLAPMDCRELTRFRFMRRLGVFGIDPDDAASLKLMGDYVLRRFERDRRAVFGVTPQGRFADVREPVSIRPGAAAIASRAEACRVVAVALEYVFWQDQRPEVLVTAAACRAEQRTTAGWHRVMRATMQDNAAALAKLSMARDGTAFSPLLDGRSGRVHPIYDLMLRVRGQAGAIGPRRRRNGRSPGP